jgi:hypothetical protein
MSPLEGFFGLFLILVVIYNFKFALLDNDNFLQKILFGFLATATIAIIILMYSGVFIINKNISIKPIDFFFGVLMFVVSLAAFLEFQGLRMANASAFNYVLPLGVGLALSVIGVEFIFGGFQINKGPAIS